MIQVSKMRDNVELDEVTTFLLLLLLLSFFVFHFILLFFFFEINKYMFEITMEKRPVEARARHHHVVSPRY